MCEFVSLATRLGQTEWLNDIMAEQQEWRTEWSNGGNGRMAGMADGIVECGMARMVEWLNGGRMAEWSNGRMARMAEWSNGGRMAEWSNGGMARMVEWRDGGMAYETE